MGVSTWALAHNDFNEIDYIWCRGLGVELEVEVLYNTVHHARNQEVKVPTGRSIRIKTTCEKQVTMLQLKYADKLYLISETITDPIQLRELDF
jgi:hypothetical protein